MNKPILSILIPALVERIYNWEQLVKGLHAQISKLKLSKEVEVLVDVDAFPGQGGRTSGIKRQGLISRSRGQYVAFIDDDDRVDNNYVELVVEGCRKGVDVVTFDLFCGSPYRTELWEFHPGEDNRGEGSMAANHLCAWRREIATRVGWCPHLGYGDDQLWYKVVNAAYPSVVEEYVENTLYYYQQNRNKTANQTRTRMSEAYKYAGDGLACYKRDGKIYIQDGQKHKQYEDGWQDVYTVGLHGVIEHVVIPKDDPLYNLFYTVKIK